MASRGLELLSPAPAPAPYPQSSNWAVHETKSTKWTREENKLFENALALYDKDTPDRWFRVATMIPGKTVSDVMKQYKELEEDVSDIEAGLVPIPGYGGNSFTLEWGYGQELDGFGGFYSLGGKRGASARSSDHERKKGVPWTEEEHRQFLLGLKKCGKGDWRNISRNFVTSRTPTQVASHAQKYFLRQLTGGKDKRRSSIHDITTVNLPDTRPPLPEQPITALQHPRTAMAMACVSSELLHWKPPTMLQHNLHQVGLHGSGFGLYGTVLQMNSRQS